MNYLPSATPGEVLFVVACACYDVCNVRNFVLTMFVLALLREYVYWYRLTLSLMRKDLTGHTGPNGHLHMPIIKQKNKQNKHAKFMVTLPHGRQQHYLAVF